MNTKQGLGPLAIVIILAVLLGGGYVAVSKKSQVKTEKPETGEKADNDAAEALPTTPTISTITPKSGPVGTTIELEGYNLLDNRGNQNLIIENSKGETASFGFGNPEHLNLSEKYAGMRFTLNEKVCKQWATDAGFPCRDWMTLVPGKYRVYVAGITNVTGENLTSNKVTFEVTDSKTANWKTYHNEEYGFEFMLPPDFSLSAQDARGDEYAAVYRTPRQYFSVHATSVARIRELARNLTGTNMNQEPVTLETAIFEKRSYDTYWDKNSVKNRMETVVGGVRAIERDESTITDNGIHPFRVTYVLRNNMLFEFSMSPSTESGFVPSERERYEMILSTFTFTK